MTSNTVCKPIDGYEDVLSYMENPATWARMCTDYIHHSKYLLKNNDLHKQLETDTHKPKYFCHIDSDTETGGVPNPTRYKESSLPKTLVCYDLANGYHDDSFIDGTDKLDAYNFYNWAGVDIFCYFSHHFVTIPTLGWINAAHLHGVKVIGTVITEWTEGTVLWNKILENPEEYKRFANSLVAIAKYFKFEGWLLNIENKVSNPEMLLAFVRYLQKKLHSEVPSALLLWYDSVTVNGDLNWQNCLNQNNNDYFEACDGIYINYSWQEKDIHKSAVAAGARLHDLYIGIDVWGRNQYGGGQFNTAAALQVAHKYGCSLAIFAPSWTYEAIDTSDKIPELGSNSLEGKTMNFLQTFMLRERALWGSIWPFLNTKLPSSLPFHTSFCRGQGLNYRILGEIINAGPWYNLRKMEYQLSASHGPHGYRLVKEGKNKTTEAIEITSPTYQNQNTYASVKGQVKSLVQRLFRQVSVTFDLGNSSAKTDQTVEFVDKKEEGLSKHNRSHSVDAHSSQMLSASEQIAQTMPENPLPIQLKSDISTDNKSDSLENSVPKIRYELFTVPNEPMCLEYYEHDSFNGGSSLLLRCGAAKQKNATLFHCDFLCENQLIIYTVTKPFQSDSNQYLNLVLSMISNSSENTFQVTLSGANTLDSKVSTSLGSSDSVQYPVNANSSEAFKEIQKYMKNEQPGFYVSTHNSYEWKNLYYLVNYPKNTISSIYCQAGLPEGDILLGEIGICAYP